MGVSPGTWCTALRIVCVVGFAVGLAHGCANGEVCAECQTENCGDLLDACSTDDDCGCVADCMGREGFPAVDKCLDSCGLSERPAAFPALEECVGIACPDTDECSSEGARPVPDDFTDIDTPGPDGGPLDGCGANLDGETAIGFVDLLPFGG